MCDTNVRLLFAGPALLVDETTEAMFSVFEMFVQLHDKAPNSIISDGQQSIVLAVEELRKNEFFTGAHMLDPWHLLKIVKAKIKGSEITKVAKLAQIERFDGTQLS